MGTAFKTEIKGEYTTAIVYRDEETIEDYAKAQIKMLCDNEVFKDSEIRVMPDVHPGAVGVVGFTADYRDKIIPNIVGSDIGCGVTTVRVKVKRKPDFFQLDKVIRANIPMGARIHAKNSGVDLRFNCEKHLDLGKVSKSMCTLGGGNHFIEVDKDIEGNFYITVHSGSRCLGKQINDYYIAAGYALLSKRGIEVPYEMTYLDSKDDLFKEYIDDCETASIFAYLNRTNIILKICAEIGWKMVGTELINSVHNCIKPLSRIIRKGAIEAFEGQKVVIPINARDGVIIGEGKGNEDWNCSAPHGAGRVASRSDIMANHTLTEYKEAMKGIYSTSISRGTLDEAPFAYRDTKELLPYLQDTIKIDKVLKAVYNIKASR